MTEKLRPLGDVVEDLERADHPRTRALFRERFADLFDEVGAGKELCTCHPLRLSARQIVYRVESGATFDAEGVRHRCDPTPPLPRWRRAKPILRRPL